MTVHLKMSPQDLWGRLNRVNGHVTLLEVLDVQPLLDYSLLVRLLSSKWVAVGLKVIDCMAFS